MIFNAIIPIPAMTSSRNVTKNVPKINGLDRLLVLVFAASTVVVFVAGSVIGVAVTDPSVVAWIVGVTRFVVVFRLEFRLELFVSVGGVCFVVEGVVPPRIRVKLSDGGAPAGVGVTVVLLAGVGVRIVIQFVLTSLSVYPLLVVMTSVTV